MHDLHLSEIWGWWEGETLRCCPCSSFQGIGMSFGGGKHVGFVAPIPTGSAPRWEAVL